MAEGLSLSAPAAMAVSFPQIQYPGDINGFRRFMIATLQLLMPLVLATPFSGPLPLPCQPVVTTLSRLQLWLPWRLVSRSSRSGCPICAREAEVWIAGMETHSLEGARPTGFNLQVDVASPDYIKLDVTSWLERNMDLSENHSK